MPETVLAKAPVSVVIPCYRCAGTIERAVDSVLAQKRLPMEIILVEDCSGDGTLDVLNKLRSNNPELIKVTQLKVNSGAASARNAGWTIATQPYVAFLDADDTWHPEKLRIQYDYMRNNPKVVLCGHQCIWFREGDAFPAISEEITLVNISAHSLLFKNAFSTPSVMLKRDIPFRFQEGVRYLEDLLLWQQIAFAGLMVVRIESPLAYVHKAFYGASGLSAQLWEMEQGELRNLSILNRAGSIDIYLYITATLFSLIKFIKRSIVTMPKILANLTFSRDAGLKNRSSQERND